MAIIDLETAKEHLCVDDDAQDADILQKMEQASAIIVSYLKLPRGTWDLGLIADLDSDGGSGPESDSGDEAPWEVKAAVCLVLGELFKNREGGDPLSQAARDLIHRLRDPALA